ncbi:MAG: proton-conducting transporter membrane subunit, partial [Myxococcota bacterium]
MLLLLFALPAAVGLALWLFHPSLRVSRGISLATSGILFATAIALLFETSHGHVEVLAFGGWRPPFGIAFAADGLSALFVLLQTGLLGVTLIALRADQHGERTVLRAHPLALLLTSGLIGGFLTGDLFNLFVMFEAVMISSYLLLQVPGTRRSLAAALPVIVINFVASALFLTGVGLLYGMVGSVNLADLSEHLGDAPVILRRVALSMLVVAFATKAALVPLCFWMPGSYP